MLPLDELKLSLTHDAARREPATATPPPAFDYSDVRLLLIDACGIASRVQHDLLFTVVLDGLVDIPGTVASIDEAIAKLHEAQRLLTNGTTGGTL